MKILIVDDSADQLVVLERALQRMGHDVVQACDAQAAWELLQREYFPVVVSDWMMPEEDGPDLCRKIRLANQKYYVYIILLTALGGKAKYLEGIRAGADDFITKPFDSDILEARLVVAERIVNLNNLLRNVEGIVNVCSYCKKVHGEDDRWQQIESFISRHTDVTFSHGVCPDCFAKFLEPELRQWEREKQKDER